MVGVIRVKNHDFTQKHHIFSNFRVVDAGYAPTPPPPLDPLLIYYVLLSVREDTSTCFHFFYISANMSNVCYMYMYILGMLHKLTYLHYSTYERMGIVY
jgi:hypothetical protein